MVGCLNKGKKEKVRQGGVRHGEQKERRPSSEGGAGERLFMVARVAGRIRTGEKGRRKNKNFQGRLIG